MIKIDIISGFLGAGKTTLIRKILDEKPKDETIALIENEFGDIGIDGTLLAGGDVLVREIYSGCICCTLAGNFERALAELIEKYHPQRIMIEPTGIAKLSDVVRACTSALQSSDVRMGMCLVVVNALNYDMYMNNWPEFFIDQIAHAKTVVFSRTQNAERDTMERISKDILRINPGVNLITTPWSLLSAEAVIRASEQDASAFEGELIQKQAETAGRSVSGHVHQTETNACGEHTHHHNAKEVFEVWAVTTVRPYTKEELLSMLGVLSDGRYGTVLRAKGIVPADGNGWMQFDFVPGEAAVREREADYTGRICVIGEKLDEAGLAALFEQD